MKQEGVITMFSLMSPWFRREVRSGRRSRRPLSARRPPWRPWLEVLEDRNLLSFWSTVAPMPTARSDLAAARGTDGRIYAIGGHADSLPLNTVEAYSPNTNTWSTVAPMSTPRAYLAAAAGSDGRIYVFGGFDNMGNILNTAEAYSPSTNTWS